MPGSPGASGALASYGDGSAGALNITTATDWTVSYPGANLQYTSVTISNTGTLIVPSGLVLRATGNVTISGNLVVRAAAADSGGAKTHPGLALAAAGNPYPGIGLAAAQAATLLRPGLVGGGAGARHPLASGGEGGGTLAVYCQGTLTVTATGMVSANGASASNPNTAGQGIIGPGGGGGGILVLMGKGGISAAGSLQALGGNGADGFDGNGGSGEGGGGGGGGGIIHLLGPTITVSGSLQVNGGAPGANSATGSSNWTSGGGGGACGGSGGSGGSITTSINTTPSAGGAGHVIQTVIPTPENLL